MAVSQSCFSRPWHFGRGPLERSHPMTSGSWGIASQPPVLEGLLTVCLMWAPRIPWEGQTFGCPTVIIYGHSVLAVFPTFLLVSTGTTSQINSMHSSPSLRIFCWEDEGIPAKAVPSFLKLSFHFVPCVHVIHRRRLSWSESCTPSQRAYNQTNQGCLTWGRFWRGRQGVFKCPEDTS